MSQEKRRRGPAPKPAEEKRTNRLSVYFTDTEYADMLKRVPRRAELCNYIRAQVLDGEMEHRLFVPEINQKAYNELGRVASNVNQIARKLNAANIIDLSQLQAELAALRLALIEGPDL
jgi:hypothetical protein